MADSQSELIELSAAGLYDMNLMMQLTSQKPFYHKWNSDRIHLVKCWARLIIQCFTQLSDSDIADVKNAMNGNSDYLEALSIETVKPNLEAHKLISGIFLEGVRDEHTLETGILKEDTSLLELLLISHDIEYVIRPLLLRMNWVAQRSIGEKMKYHCSQLKDSEEFGSIGFAVNELKKWTVKFGSANLPAKEKTALEELISDLTSIEKTGISIEDLRNWINHRDFIIGEESVILNIHPRKGRRLRITKDQIRYLKFQIITICFLLITLDNMFYKYMRLRIGDIKPAENIRQEIEESSNPVRSLKCLGLRKNDKS